MKTSYPEEFRLEIKKNEPRKEQSKINCVFLNKGKWEY